MTNIYLLWIGGTPPSPWQLISTYDGRYLRTVTAYAQAGATGGSSSHSHSVTNFICGYIPINYQRGGIASANFMIDHNCHPLGANSVSSSNNDPLYYTFQLICMDLAAWEASERRIPRDALFLSESAISSWAEVARYSASDGYLIKIAAAAGSSGGRSSHDHTVNIALGSCNGYAPSLNSPPTQSLISGIAHTHGSTATTPPSATILPKRVRTRIYKAGQLTTKALAGMICFVDNTPSDYWDDLGWADCFIECADVNATITGGSSHGHSGGAGTSAAFTRSNTVSSYGGIDIGTLYNVLQSTITEHTHPYAYDLSSDSHEPLYANLVPVRLNTTLYHINSYDATYVDDLLLRKTFNAGVPTSIRMKGAGTEIITPDILLQKTVPLGVPFDSVLGKRLTATFDNDALIKTVPHRSWLASLKLIIPLASMAASLRLIQPNQTTYPVLDAILKAWTTQLDKIQMRISVMDLSNKLDYATDSEIDLKWGAVYNLHRFADESDEHYRKRIKTYTMIQTGSGTRGVCEAVLDEIVDEPGASRVVTWEPGNVRIYWDSNTAPKVASERKGVIDCTVPMMLAAGIEWTMFLEYVELLMGMHLKGADLIVYYTDLLLQVQDKTFEYYIRPRLMARAIEEMDADTVLKAAFLKTFIVNSSVKKGTDRTISMDEHLLKHCAIGTPFDLLERATVTKPYLMRQRLQKFDIDRTIHADALVERDFKRNVYAILSVVFQIAAEALFDMRLQRYDINKLFLANTVIEKQFDDTAAMDFILVTA